MVTPGIFGVSDQGLTTPWGVAIWSGESCDSGAAMTSVCVPRCVRAISENRSARSWKTWKSERASHGGSIAALKAWT